MAARGYWSNVRRVDHAALALAPQGLFRCSGEVVCDRLEVPNFVEGCLDRRMCTSTCRVRFWLANKLSGCLARQPRNRISSGEICPVARATFDIGDELLPGNNLGRISAVHADNWRTGREIGCYIPNVTRRQVATTAIRLSAALACMSRTNAGFRRDARAGACTSRNRSVARRAYWSDVRSK